METVTVIQGAMNAITVNGVEYVPRQTPADERLRIVIVDNRGLTFVGKVSLTGEDQWLSIREARCVIYWGTTQHIAELANAPTSKVRLGLARDVLVRRNNVIAVYDCGEGWNGK